MRRLVAVAAALGLFAALLAVGIPAQASKPVSTTNQMTTTAVVSAFDGSEWLMFQAEKISQPGNAIWVIQWKVADGSPCTYRSSGVTYAQTTTGEVGAQTGTTWGPTAATFSYAQGFALQMDTAVPNVVGHTLVGPWTGSLDAPFTYRSCDHGVLVSGQAGKPWKVLDNYVPLPWSIA